MKRRYWRVAAAQMKFAPSIGGNLALIERAAHEAANLRADVLLFPECATTGSCRLDIIVTANAAPPISSATSSVRRYAGPPTSGRVRGSRSSLAFNS